MTENALTIKSLKKSFGNIPVIRGVDLAITKGERHALIGPNGAGKSTLFNLISGLMPPTSGDILLKNKQIAGLPSYEISRMGLSRSFQITNVFSNMSVRENVRCAILWSSGQRYRFWGTSTS